MLLYKKLLLMTFGTTPVQYPPSLPSLSIPHSPPLPLSTPLSLYHLTPSLSTPSLPLPVSLYPLSIPLLLSLSLSLSLSILLSLSLPLSLSLSSH